MPEGDEFKEGPLDRLWRHLRGVQTSGERTTFEVSRQARDLERMGGILEKHVTDPVDGVVPRLRHLEQNHKALDHESRKHFDMIANHDERIRNLEKAKATTDDRNRWLTRDVVVGLVSAIVGGVVVGLFLWAVTRSQ